MARTIGMGTAHRGAGRSPLGDVHGARSSSDARTGGGARALLPWFLKQMPCVGSSGPRQAEMCTTQSCNRSGIGYNWEAGLR